jgi:predicted glycoside hydrolase/deacetylase ChbG (UPF0249 family)
MIIISADDFGRSVTETDAAAALAERGRVTSLSAMVFMQDSERAAELAQGLNADVGLHLNFCEQWTSRRVPGWLGAHHQSLRAFFNLGRYAVVIYNPVLRRAFDAVYKAEFDEFVRLYGRQPSHIDGHRHLHLCANVLVDRIIPPGSNVRRNFSFARGEKGRLNRGYRWFVDACLRRSYSLTDYFFSLDDCLSGRGRSMATVAELAQVASVEVMTHPKESDEFSYLDGEGCSEVLNSVARGTFSDLPVKERLRLDAPLFWSMFAGLWQCVLI